MYKIIRYGLQEGEAWGVTFHTLRRTSGSWLGQM